MALVVKAISNLGYPHVVDEQGQVVSPVEAFLSSPTDHLHFTFEVHSQEWLDTKQSQLAQIKREALKRYFANGGTAEQRAIDQAVILGTVGKIGRNVARWINQYWSEAYHVDVCGAETHLTLVHDVFAVYEEQIDRAYAKFIESTPIESLNLDTLNVYSTELERTLVRTVEQMDQLLEQAIPTAADRNIKARWNYQLFISKLWMPIDVKRTVRKHMSSLLEDHKNNLIPLLADLKEEENQKKITSCLNALELIDSYANPQKIAQRWPNKSAEEQAKILEDLQIKRAGFEDKLKELQSKTPTTFLEQAQKEYGYSPEKAKYYQILVEETPFQKTAECVYDLIRIFMRDNFFRKPIDGYDPDLKYDLSKDDPVAYFAAVFADHYQKVRDMLQTGVCK